MHFSKPLFYLSRAQSLPTRGLARPRGPEDFSESDSASLEELPTHGLDSATVCAVNAFEWTCKPEWNVRPRRVGDDMWFFIRSGACRYRLGGQTKWGLLQAGDLILIPQGIVHELAPASPPRRVTCNTVHFFFRGVGGVDLLRIWDLAGVYRSKLNLPELNHQLAAEFAVKKPGWLPGMNAIIWLILIDLIRSHTDLHPPTSAMRNQWERIQPVLHAIEERLNDPCLRVGDLARTAHVSEAYLRRLFNGALGCGVVEFIQRRRLDLACQLLLETNRGLKEIAAATGFRSLTLFHRLFIRRFGVTPATYRDAPPHDGTSQRSLAGSSK